jgi:phosphodiesterase/alkaline phosphatase D-like protein
MPVVRCQLWLPGFGKRVMGKPKRNAEQLKLSRRQALLSSASVLAGAACSQPATRQTEHDEPPCNALGERVGEVTDRSAIVHTRLTAASTRNERGYSFPIWTHNLTLEQRLEARVPNGMLVAELEGSCAGKAGQARLHYSTQTDLTDATVSEWTAVAAATDFTYSFVLEGLQPDTIYSYAVETKSLSGTETRRGNTGSFRTAPPSQRWQPVRFAAITCQDYACRDHRGGFKTYASMKRLSPTFWFLRETMSTTTSTCRWQPASSWHGTTGTACILSRY